MKRSNFAMYCPEKICLALSCFFNIRGTGVATLKASSKQHRYTQVTLSKVYETQGKWNKRKTLAYKS